MSITKDSITLITDIICLVAEILGNDGCDSSFTLLTKLTSSSTFNDVNSRIAEIGRPVVLQFGVTERNLSVWLPICPKSISGTIMIDWGDNTISYYHEISEEGEEEDEEEEEEAAQNGTVNRKRMLKNPTHVYSTSGSYYVRVFRKYRTSCLAGLTTCEYRSSCEPVVWNWTHNLRKFCSIGTIGVTSLKRLFACQNRFDLPLSHVDVSCCINMEYLFRSCEKFNQNLASWNVGNVVDMSGMFCGATLFNQPIASWDVSAVEKMTNMFSSAASFNQPLETWDVSAVQLMDGMFFGARSFNQPILGWNVSAVRDMDVMFTLAVAFNQPLHSWNVECILRPQHEWNVFGRYVVEPKH